MSYRIVYGKDKTRYRQPPKPWKKPVICAAIGLSLIFIFHATGLSGTLWQFLLPGDPDVTSQALHTLVDNIKCGAPLSETVTAFCQEIIHGANLS